MSLHAPLFCAICAAPCTLPRASVKPPLHAFDSAENPATLGDTDTTSATPPGPLPVHPTSAWLAQWHVLKVTSGLITTFTVHPAPPLSTVQTTATSAPQEIPSYDPLPSVISLSSPVPASPFPASSNARCVPIHHFCLSRVQSTVRRSMYNMGFSHEENMMLGWSLPKWVGYGPWVARADRGGEALGDSSGNVRVGYWAGATSQRERFSRSGTHLIEVSASPGALTLHEAYRRQRRGPDAESSSI